MTFSAFKHGSDTHTGQHKCLIGDHSECVIRKTAPSHSPVDISGDITLDADQRVCAQCEANARHNEAGGYAELAAECRAYCLRGHKPSQDQG